MIRYLSDIMSEDNELLIKVRATSVTSTDCNVRDFTFVPGVFQIPARLFMFGVFKPRINILGIDIAGEIEAVGKNVRRFKEGDQVLEHLDWLLVLMRSTRACQKTLCW